MRARRRSRRRAAQRPSGPRRPASAMPCSAASSSAGWIAEALGFVALLLGQRDLGVDLARRRCQAARQALEGGAVVEPGSARRVVEVVDVERLGALGAARRRACSGRRRGPLGEGAARRAGSTGFVLALGAGVDRDLAAAVLVGAETETWICTAPSPGRTSGASRVSSSTVSAPACSPARRASSTKAVPGSRTVPRRRGRPARGGWRARGGR